MEKDLRKLRKAELLAIIDEQSKENERLATELEIAKVELKSREIKIEKAGSIARAALELNGIFEAADRAGAQYLENIEKLSSEQEQISADLIRKSQEEADKLMAETIDKCEKMEKESQEKCIEMTDTAKEHSREYYEEAKNKLEAYIKEHEALEKFFQPPFSNINIQEKLSENI